MASNPFEKPVFFVKDCGKAFEDIVDREKELYTLTTDLTEDEKKSKYARYYYLGQAAPTNENLIAVEPENPLDLSEAFTIEEYAARMDKPGAAPVKTGYCVLPNGVGFAAARTVQYGVTEEVMQHFLDNFNPEYDLFYKTWCPGSHVRHYANMAVEDVGWGMAQLRFIEGLNAEKIGIPVHNDPLCIGITGANILAQPFHQPDAEPLKVSELCYYRILPEGYELTVTFWLGMHFENGKSVLHLPNSKPVDILYPQLLARHSLYETATVARNTYQFWLDSKAGMFD